MALAGQLCLAHDRYVSALLRFKVWENVRFPAFSDALWKPLKNDGIGFVRILAVEDDHELASFIAGGIRRAGHEVTVATSGEDALGLIAGDGFDAMVLDRMLPGMDGIALLRQIRRSGNRVPVLMLTALDGIDDRVAGLEAGADDHVGKPFAMTELLARLNALTRRNSLPEMTSRISEGDLTIDLLRREVRNEGKLVPLQPREMALLEELMRNAGEAVTRQMLLERVWGFRFDPQTSIVETHVSRLRSKLSDSGVRATIETVRNIGYRFRAHAADL
ncbi:winged helix-turn-helix domain-containing protein [soil metagenome]